MSALFAPPPENADSLPPNRARGPGTAGGGPGGGAGDPNGPSQNPQLDWFSMFSANRARGARNRVRIGGRADDDSPPASRLFSRFGRNRPGLRPLGDFVVSAFHASVRKYVSLNGYLVHSATKTLTHHTKV